jgi:hypothetical protein
MFTLAHLRKNTGDLEDVMEKCAHCGNETEMFVGGVPQCVGCTKKFDGAFLRRDNERVHQALWNEVVAAKQRSEVASTAFDEITQDSPSGLPHSDSVLRVHVASRVYTQARQDLQIAIRRLNAFVVDGTVPDDLDNNSRP